MATDDSKPPSPNPFGVSFVVTLYNKERYIAQVLAAILRQELSCPSEIVICDDGSTDGSTAVAERIIADNPDRSWCYFRIPNSGPAVATNRGAARARYRYIKLVDADDFMPPQATRHLLSLVETHPTASLIFGKTVDIATAAWFGLADRTDWPLARDATVAPHPLVLLHKKLTFGPTNMLIPTAKYRDCGGCDEDIFSQDYSLALNLTRVGALIATSLPVSYYPDAVDGRISGTAQAYHDFNKAMHNHLGRVALTEPQLRRIAATCLGRALKYHRRHIGHSVNLRVRSHYVAIKLGIRIDYRDAIFQSLPLFGPVRGCGTGSINSNILTS